MINPFRGKQSLVMEPGNQDKDIFSSNDLRASKKILCKVIFP